MKRVIQEHDLFPLKREISKLNEISYNPLSMEYIDFLIKENVPFSYKNHPFQYSVTSSFKPSSKNDFFNHLKSNKNVFLEFNSKDDKALWPELFLDTFIGKDFIALENIFIHLAIEDKVCDFYRAFGLLALTPGDKNIFNQLTNTSLTSAQSQSMAGWETMLYHANLPYIIQNHTILFEGYDLNLLWDCWLVKVNHFEENAYNRHMHSTGPTNNKPSMGNQIFRKAKSFCLKLAGAIILKQNNEEIENLFNQYSDILSHRDVFEFFKNNHSPDFSPSYKVYRKYIQQYKNTDILVEEKEFIQKNLKVDITSIVQKHFLTYDRSCQLLKGMFNFLKEHPEFQNSLISFNEEDKKCTFSLTSTSNSPEYLKNGVTFFNKVINDKTLFMNPDSYQATFSFLRLDNKFELKNVKSVKTKI